MYPNDGNQCFLFIYLFFGVLPFKKKIWHNALGQNEESNSLKEKERKEALYSTEKYLYVLDVLRRVYFFLVANQIRTFSFKICLFFYHIFILRLCAVKGVRTIPAYLDVLYHCSSLSFAIIPILIASKLILINK